MSDEKSVVSQSKIKDILLKEVSILEKQKNNLENVIVELKVRRDDIENSIKDKIEQAGKEVIKKKDEVKLLIEEITKLQQKRSSLQ